MTSITAGKPLNAPRPGTPATGWNPTGFDRVFLHPVTGAVLTVDRYTPNAALKRLLLARDVRCAFPGCRHPAIRSEIDHRKDHAKGGTTDEARVMFLPEPQPDPDAVSAAASGAAPF